MRKGNVARRREGHRGGKCGLRRIERANRSEEKIKTLNDSVHRLHLDSNTQLQCRRQNHKSQTSLLTVLPTPTQSPPTDGRTGAAGKEPCYEGPQAIVTLQLVVILLPLGGRVALKDELRPMGSS